MQVKTEQEALYVACEMESTAIALYDRALRVMEQLGRQEEPLYRHIVLMRADEQEHLKRFRSLYTGLDATVERQLELSAIAEGVLFEGGLMGAARNGLLDDVEGMLAFAMNAETTSARKYREFAQLATDERAKAALSMIAAEEDKHLDDLKAQA